MPIATPQGTLDFKSVDKVTFVGASSNTVIDTTTGSLGVGVGVGGPTSNLHVVGDALITGNVSDLNIVSNVNMLHTSNTASIKLNSNVVTEFPRSKKLIKYPRVALTSEIYNGYIVTSSDEVNAGSSASWQNWKAFGNFFPADAHAWLTQQGTYPATAGDAVTSGTDTNGDSLPKNLGTDSGGPATANGSWLKLKLPHKITLQFIKMTANDVVAPDDFDVLGSNDDTNWSLLGSFTTPNPVVYTRLDQYDINAVTSYLYYAVIIKSHRGSNHTYSGIYTLEYYGVPEYDPDAHGTDVVVKSIPNVPSTDWLEVYYDAKSYSTLPDSVNDESGSTNTFNGTIPSGHQITFDDGDIKAFVFPGRDSTTPLQYPDYIQTTLSGWSDNQPHTQSCWFKPASITSFDQVFGLWDVASTNYEYSAFGIYTDKFAYYHFGSEFQYPYDVSSLIGTWCHISAIHTGYIPDTKVYLNGHLLSGSRTQGSDNTLSLGTAPKLALGKDPGRGIAGQEWAFHGSIANYRLFNRALTSDEIYQLYAYQKEYFGHGYLSMTLKAGRLGIGTSEPRAALDVRGDVYISGSLRKTRALMFIRNTGSYNFTTENTFQTIVDYGPPWVAYSTNPLYNISHTGDYTDTNYHHLYLRIAVKNESTGDVVYFPNSTGWRYYVHTTHQRLDEHSYQGIFSGLIIGNSYTTRYEIKPMGVSSYKWSSIYGDITGIVWD